MIKYLGALLLTVLLAGCGDSEEKVYDIDFYKSHEKERLTKLDWCKVSTERRLTINCVNAHEAQEMLDVDTMFGEGFKKTE